MGVSFTISRGRFPYFPSLLMFNDTLNSDTVIQIRLLSDIIFLSDNIDKYDIIFF